MFLSGIEAELELLALAQTVDTIFWGGGTPGLLAPKDLTRLGESVRSHGGGATVEWTVEMAPASVTEARLRALQEVGVTRISMGAQSFQPALLDALGRQHTREQIFRAYDRVRAVGFASVNLDLMFALPGQDETAWLRDLDEAMALAPDHLSTYCLTFEEDTKMWVKLSQGRVKLDPEREARLYATTWDRLAMSGYEQYEVSNFARPGHQLPAQREYLADAGVGGRRAVGRVAAPRLARRQRGRPRGLARGADARGLAMTGGSGGADAGAAGGGQLDLRPAHE
jgi:oxygen-independent coproporphyrinogen III oxidase